MKSKTKEKLTNLAIVFGLAAYIITRCQMNNNAALDFVTVKDKEGKIVYNDFTLKTNETLPTVRGEKTLTIVNSSGEHQKPFPTDEGYSWTITEDSVNFNKYYEQRPEIEKPKYP